MVSGKLRIMVIGAHPDDCESKAGGVGALWAQKGHVVRFVSATDGQTGHHEIGGAALAQRRIAEAKAAADVIGIESQVLPIPNGQIEPSLPFRWMMIRTIRQFKPDLVLTHRPNDYHPDHRYTSQLVQDSAYTVTVPNTVPETPALRYNPVMGYLSDRFEKPYPFTPTVVIDIDDVIDRKIDMLHCHSSQVYEWLAWHGVVLDEVPEDDKARREWLFERYAPRSSALADRFRDMLIARYGKEKGSAVKYAEAFEGCEYGTKLDETQIERLFPDM